MLVYLAGAMTYYHSNNDFKKATQWRDSSINFLKEHNINCFNPCKNFDKNITYNPKGVVLQNKCFLEKSDIILVNLDNLNESAGTMFELFYAYLNHKPVIAYGENYLYPNQPHISEAINMKFDKLYEALEYIVDMYCHNI